MLLCLSGCGPGVSDLELQNGPRQPRLVLQGDCAPSTAGTLLQVESREARCLSPLNAPQLVETQAAYDALFDQDCEKPEVDFASKRVLVVPARGASEWFVFPNFVTQRFDALEVGLVIRPQGALPPDALVFLPRTPAAVELHWCRSVCVENCDVALP